ncbi:ImmA/IrrE family metallo-endopeptidase [Paraliobacillus ryukyuensis]|uniref:ImmA/IrrE family metallo-endopeptidase n=1 Tax=Paraliobacillus ryukyuensis TaxID=200904 RepID=UPI0009A5B01A|nr:ImmA/IrrE family metallo-endopeptidase [Paraliobacillus ryukyuensis]
MFESYHKTDLETWLENLYKKHGILTLSDLTINNVSRKLKVDIIFMENAKELAIWDEEDAAIFLNPNKSNEEVRAIFFHELCHPLRHYGDQLEGIDTFTALQERQANQFMLYASMPFFMIKDMVMPQFDYQWGSFLAHEFNVPLYLANKRADQLLQRIKQASIDQIIKEQYSLYNINNKPKH